MGDPRNERAVGGFIECLMICDTVGEESLGAHLTAMTHDELLEIAACAIAHNFGLLKGMATIDGQTVSEILPLVAQDLWGDHYGFPRTG